MIIFILSRKRSLKIWKKLFFQIRKYFVRCEFPYPNSVKFLKKTRSRCFSLLYIIHSHLLSRTFGNRNLTQNPLFSPSPFGGGEKERKKEITEKVSETSNSDSGLKEALDRGRIGGSSNRGKVEESTVHFIDAIKTNIIRRRRKRGRNAIDRTRELARTHQTGLFFTRSGFLRTTGHLRELLPSALARSQRTPPRHSTQTVCIIPILTLLPCQSGKSFLSFVSSY